MADTTLAFNRFAGLRQRAHVFILGAYFFAQYLIAKRSLDPLSAIVERAKRVTDTDKAVLVLTDEHSAHLDLDTLVVRGRLQQHPQEWWWHRLEELGRVVFSLVEFQIFDRETARRNEEGDSSHDRYKRRQHQEVLRRLSRGLVVPRRSKRGEP